MSNSPDRLTAAFDQVKKDFRMLTNPKTYESMSQNQVIGALTVLLLVVGVTAGVYLGGQQQDLRQQAAYPGETCSPNGAVTCDGDVSYRCENGVWVQTGFCTPTPVCVPTGQQCTNSSQCCDGSCNSNGRCQSDVPQSCGPFSNNSCLNGNVGDTCFLTNVQSGVCVYVSGTDRECDCVGSATPIPVNDCRESCLAAGDNPGSCSGLPSCPACREQCNAEFGGASAYCNGLRSCGSPDCPGQPSGSFCAEPGGSCGTLSPVTDGCESTGGVSCCPGGPVSPRPSNTPTGVPPTNVPPTNVPPTNVPPTNVPPTNRPPTNTPTRTPTPTPSVTPGGPTLTATNTPTNTPVIAPICVNVVMNNPASNTPNTPPNIGDIVTLTCSQVAGATRYEFRFRLPDLSYVMVNPSVTTPYVSQQYQIPSAGSFSAACRPCATADASSCAPWEN